MKINAVIMHSKPKAKKDFFYDNKTSLITFLIMLISVIAGTVIYVFYKEIIDDKIADAFNWFNSEFITKSKPEIFSGLLLNNVVVIGMMFLFSTSVIGLPFIYMLLAIRLTGLSALVSFLYSSYGLLGIEYSSLIIMPGKFLMLLSMMVLTDSSVTMSELIRKSDKNNKREFSKHSIRTIITIIISLLGVFTDFVLYILFSDLFAF